ncbi:Shikimate dehydrogenase (NADP(+)) [Frankliniella fusca]|uniref:Shikimate dehydrogenase (NADP(+)) n=1 Tax=Frankliniella fusca TaxID=407009 RepID=A0AAE1HIR8_9NEOP|nr:Shikimate dehydrogenase (NADP(+)) [Frankliniella fusca]
MVEGFTFVSFKSTPAATSAADRTSAAIRLLSFVASSALATSGDTTFLVPLLPGQLEILATTRTVSRAADLLSVSGSRRRWKK